MNRTTIGQTKTIHCQQNIIIRSEQSLQVALLIWDNECMYRISQGYWIRKTIANYKCTLCNSWKTRGQFWVSILYCCWQHKIWIKWLRHLYGVKQSKDNSNNLGVFASHKINNWGYIFCIHVIFPFMLLF